jgi:NADH oxidase (H2O-forming)
MNSVELTKNIHWVGAEDPDLRVFDIVVGTDFGTTYNSYLVRGQKVALIDAVKQGFEERFFAKIEEHVPLANIDYLIVNHTEPDHSGAIKALLARNPGIKLVCSKPAVPFLRNIINDESILIEGVKGGDRLDLGGLTLEFISAPFMHWPDTMFTYCPEEEILFSCDAFAAHFAPRDSIFARADDPVLEREVWRYYDAIMRPFAPYGRRASESVIGKPIKMVAPSHGPINRDDPKRFIAKYIEWTSPKAAGEKKRILIAFASSYGNTRTLAQEIDKVLEQAGANTIMVDLTSVSERDLRDHYEAADAIMFGTPTFVGDVVKPVWNAAQLLMTVSSVGKKAAVFGSYAWGGQAVDILESYLDGLKLKVHKPGLKARLVPSQAELDECRRFAEAFYGFVQQG